MDTLFSVSSFLVMPFWFLMIVLPRWTWTQRLIKSPWIAAPPAVLYVWLVGPQLGEVLVSLANPTLAEVAALIGQPAGAVIAWVHFLAFDLFVGRWAYLDSRQHDVNVWLMAPILFFILMVGPLGFLLYLGLRTAVLRLRQNHGHPSTVRG